MDEILDIMFDPPEEGEQFAVDTLDKANWAARKLAKAEHEIAKTNSYVAELKRRLDDMAEKRNKDAKETVERMGLYLKGYAEKELRESKKRHIDLFLTRIGFRKSPERKEIIDEAAAMAYCEVNDAGAVKTTKTILVSKLTDPAKTPGVKVVEGGERFYIDVDKDGLDALEAP